MTNHEQAVAKANAYMMQHQDDVNKRFYPNFHLAAPCGWINDPNGFCYALGKYHIFYQYYPYDSKWGPCHWGHATSTDLIHWEHLPVALAPSEDYDNSGCFSGSAIEHNGKLYLAYTGHHVIVEKGDDSIFREVQVLAVSEDGINFKKLGIIIEPEDDVMHFRDPKVWRDENGLFHLVLGASNPNDKGEPNKNGVIRHYTNPDIEDLKGWKFTSNVFDFGTESFMPECPDIFSVNDNKWVIACSPMGMTPEGYNRQNPATNVWLSGNFDGTNFTADNTFYEVDHGHDFYATQSALAPDGRRILLAWMNMWRLPFLSYHDNWCGALTLPREVWFEDGHIWQRPVKEAESLRVKAYDLGDCSLTSATKTLCSNAAATELHLTIKPEENKSEQYGLALGNSIRLYVDRQTGTLTLFRMDLNATSYRALKLDLTKEHQLQIFIDNSSIEVFVDGGKECFTTNFFGDNKLLSLYSTNGTAVFHNVKMFDLERPLAWARA